MKKLIKFLTFPIYLLTLRYYYVSGTFIDKQGTRMFFRTVFESSFYRFPYKTLESEMGQVMNARTGQALITNIQRIPLWMAREFFKGSDGQVILETNGVNDKKKSK